MTSSATTTSQTVTIRVLAASTGIGYKISLHPSELTVANIRSHLAAAVPAQDQILLLGPPYKVPKDNTLQSEEILNSLRLGDKEDDPSTEDADPQQSKPQHRSILTTTERSGARRLFLFSKQSLSENAPDPPACDLGPLDVTLPSEPPGSSPLNMTQSAIASQPLHQALSAYERQFMLYLCQGRVLADAADMRFQACQQCVREQAVMARALRAAVSNHADHFNGAARTRTEFSALFQSKTANHSSLLQRFDSILTGLGAIPLHSALVTIARGSGRIMETLLDTVPVERERAWAQQCQKSHERLLALFSELDDAFAKLGSTNSREEDTRQDLLAEQHIQELSDEVQDVAQKIRDQQAKRLEKLTTDHGQVVKTIMDAVNAEAEEGKEDEVQKAFTPLRQISNDSKDIVPEMEADDKVIKELMKKVADAKTEAMKRMKVRLREVSVAQSSIQRVLQSVSVLKSALSQQCDNMIHLEHVAELATAYRDFKTELRRRRAYGQAVTSNTTAMMDRLAVMRTDEVKARERFLRGPGRHLMPPFFEIFVPTLATPPPLFTPQLPALVELDTLPDIGTDNVEDTVMQGGVDAGGVSSASSLTAESHHVQQEAGTAEETMATASAQQQDQLIVSADENSGNDDVIMNPAVGADDAERKTLAYENAILRQQLERMGGKAPKAYVEEAQAKDDGSKEVVALRKELEMVKTQAKSAQDALISAKKENPKQSDKISHSSFEIGDVGLFMPTGRGSGGKRTYLAFHTNCPHRYLSTDNINGNPDFVLGRIVYQEELVAGEVGTDANPYGLHVGTKFWVLTVEVLKSSAG
mmetsp:Transcript_133465/g.198387  ORF Transcript_133465/g.198387 Transcript_133465/m.198387 type:complete len:815 (+) Transcript_133465:73-2517(+)|eukprot:CAMPEP_0117023890 /NCGR_PEP_ID=MMETSP0472-20121206/17790_1 /TAXON_ID=693140 ORGANISM="Tiarina fusus, Strain LIS" /NCGR_SAMPLE_ID=MMETSP0472 /ASSEMBLY_ACC=CAM_ASM_000603 /LENGTH=814 /DNA_ID=CAMNT_0004730151 /DNA_START=52 /DNA_END=2496 /DNA_ORIENTATION=+